MKHRGSMLRGGSSHCFTAARLQETQMFEMLRKSQNQHLRAKGDEVSRKGMPLLGLSPTTHLDTKLLDLFQMCQLLSAVQMGDMDRSGIFCDKCIAVVKSQTG